MSRFGFIYDQTACIGCNACQMACKDRNNTENGLFIRRADTMKLGDQWLHFSGACNHCADAPCVKHCQGGALFIQMDGTIGHRKEACVGCSTCMRYCPYGAIRVSAKTHQASKCDGCYDLRQKGNEPACVGACLTRCLTFGDLDEFYEKLDKEEREKWSSEFPILPDANITKPNILIKRSPELIKIMRETSTAKKIISEEKISVTEEVVSEEKIPVAEEMASREKTAADEVMTDGKKPVSDAEIRTAVTSAAENYFLVNPPTGYKSLDHHVAGTRNPFQRPSAKFPKGREALAFYRDILSDFESAKDKLVLFSGLGEMDAHELKLVYDRILRGCNPDLKLPLWASVCDGSNVLMNQTTLDVIHAYHKMGYEPVWMEGNPPDYLGEQLNYLLYLAKAYVVEKGLKLGKIKGSFRRFLTEYTLPLAEAICAGAREYKDIPKGFTELFEQMLLCLKDRSFADACMKASKDGCLPLNDPIADEEEHIINTGGINNCGGICVIRPHVADNCVLRIESDCNPDHAWQIRACVRGRGYRATFLNSDRLRYPMKRVGKRGSGQFERISWEEAVDLLYENWIRIKEKYGPGSRYIQYGTGVEGIMRPGKLMRRLLSLDGGSLDYFNSYSSACVNTISNYTYGTWASGSSPADFLNTKLLILWADNTAESIFGPERNLYLSLAKKKGIRIIVIDPRLSQTGVTYAADKEDWFAIKPATDAALADAMAYVIWSEGLQDQSFMDKYCIGFDEEHMPAGVPANESYHSYLFGRKDGIAKTPEWAETITGIEADRIRGLARLYATTKPACITQGLGAQRHGNGEQSARGVMMLCCLTGNVGISGGNAGGNASGLVERHGIDLFTGSIVNPYKGEIPVFLWTKAIEKGTTLTPLADRLKGVDRLESGIKLLFNLASDVLINQHSDINDTIRILSDESLCEFIVCSDIFMTPSARYADLILPATSFLEGDNIINPWSGNNYLIKNNKVMRPLFDCRFEWEWIKELSKKLGLYEEFIDGKPQVEDWLRENYEYLRKLEDGLPDYETFRQAGGWMYKKHHDYIAFKDQIEHPESCPFNTPSGKIEIFSKTLYDMNLETQKEKAFGYRKGPGLAKGNSSAGHSAETSSAGDLSAVNSSNGDFSAGEYAEISAIPGYRPAADGPFDDQEVYPLMLIGWHTRRRCHTIHDNNKWQDEIEMPGVWIHPEDAKERGIENGAEVLIYNDHGKVQIPAIVTDRICKGVTAISQGGWFTPDKEGTDRRGSINVLTSTKSPTPIAKGNPQHSNRVEIRPVG